LADRLLLDTHALIWAANDLDKLSKTARVAIENEENQIFVSAVSAIEITTKFRVGKLPEADELSARFEAIIAEFGFAELPVSVNHARVAGLLPFEHRDPFDRMLIAQAQIEQMTLVSNEKLFDQFGVIRLW
jgi:PIN domain nuclease of toxin-antitoxin system